MNSFNESKTISDCDNRHDLDGDGRFRPGASNLTGPMVGLYAQSNWALTTVPSVDGVTADPGPRQAEPLLSRTVSGRARGAGALALLAPQRFPSLYEKTRL